MVLKKVKQSLFWFLKRDAVLDISSPGTRQMYVQQVLSCGRAEDIKELFKDIGPDQLRRSFEEMKWFLPKEVRMFWEGFFAGH